MFSDLFNRFRKQNEPITLGLKLASPERARLLSEAPAKALKEIDRSEIPPPESPLTPILIASRWISHDLYNEDMPGIAADLLEAGYDTPALIRLAGETQIYASPDADRLIGKAFQELGVPWPLPEVQAKLIATRHIAREVMVGMRDPYRAASELEIVLWNWGPLTEDLVFLFALNDELSWDPEYQRYIPVILQDELIAFGRLACLTDEQIAHESERAGSAGK